MPKKFSGANTKSAVARARKETARTDEQERKKQTAEDAYWRDDDKVVAKKLQRKEDAEKKRLMALQKKLENREAHDKEMESLDGKIKSQTTKVTRASIEANQRLVMQCKEEESRLDALRKKNIEVSSDQLEENVNLIEGDEEIARSINDAINLLSISTTNIDRHPEKRMKAAYQEFEEKWLLNLKQKHPTFRLSQLKQLLKKEWQKSPENPLNPGYI